MKGLVQPVTANSTCEASLLCYAVGWDCLDAKFRTTAGGRQHHVNSNAKSWLRWSGHCGRHWWVRHNFEGSMFCRRVGDTHATIKPASAPASTNGSLENAPRVSLLLSFTAHAHWSNQLSWRRFANGPRRCPRHSCRDCVCQKMCGFCFSLRNDPNAGGCYPCAPRAQQHPFARADDVPACAELRICTSSVVSFDVRA